MDIHNKNNLDSEITINTSVNFMKRLQNYHLFFSGQRLLNILYSHLQTSFLFNFNQYVVFVNLMLLFYLLMLADGHLYNYIFVDLEKKVQIV